MNVSTDTRFDSETEYGKALITVLGLARQSLCILDRDLSRLRFHEADMATKLECFLAGAEKPTLKIAVHDVHYIERRPARFTQLVDHYSAQVSIRSIPANLRHLGDCHVLADEAIGVRRFHANFPRGALILDDYDEIAPWLKRFEELWEESTPWRNALNIGN